MVCTGYSCCALAAVTLRVRGDRCRTSTQVPTRARARARARARQRRMLSIMHGRQRTGRPVCGMADREQADPYVAWQTRTEDRSAKNQGSEEGRAQWESARGERLTASQMGNRKPRSRF